jgi:hypothetical protein
MAQESPGPAEQPGPRQPRPEQPISKRRKLRYDWSDVLMLSIIMAALTGIFLGGIGIIVGVTNFESADVVAIISPPLGVVSAVAAGVFGYSLGARSTAQANERAAATREDAAIAVAPLARVARRISDDALKGKESIEGKRHVSEDDLKGLRDAADALASRVGTGPQLEE